MRAETIEIEPFVCIHCGTHNEMATGVLDDAEKAKIEDGDCAICYSCGQMMIFEIKDSRRRLREPTLVELAEITTNVKVEIVRRAMTYSGDDPEDQIKRALRPN